MFQPLLDSTSPSIMNPSGQILTEINWQSFPGFIAPVLTYISWAWRYFLVKWTKVTGACLQDSELKCIFCKYCLALAMKAPGTLCRHSHRGERIMVMCLQLLAILHLKKKELTVLIEAEEWGAMLLDPGPAVSQHQYLYGSEIFFFLLMTWLSHDQIQIFHRKVHCRSCGKAYARENHLIINTEKDH